MSMSAATRFRYTVVAGVTAVVIGVGFAAVGVARSGSGSGATVPSAADAPLGDTASASEEPLLDDSAVPSAPTSIPPAPSPSATSASPKPTKTATSKPKTTKKASTSAPTTGDAILDAVLSHINAARADEGLKALTLDTQLSKASALHTALMINGCGLEHQCSGESGIGTRFSAQGVSWKTAGENIGFGSSGSSNAQIISAANGLTDSMLAEKAPNDGHRKNLLNSAFTKIGLSIVRDSKGITWMTQDFVG